MKCIKCGAELPQDALYCLMCGKKQIPEKRKALKRANGMGTVYKLSGRRKRPWVASKNRVIIGYYPRKTDALEHDLRRGVQGVEKGALQRDRPERCGILRPGFRCVRPAPWTEIP